MPIFQLSDEHIFPPARLASEDGIVAVGGDLNPNRILEAYRHGIFPWPHEGYPLLWFSPDPRFILKLSDFRIPRTVAKQLKKSNLVFKIDTNFKEVMLNCAYAKRAKQDGTWITDEMIEGYTELHKKGHAHSVEIYADFELVGGLYGISVGKIFCGESMFSKIPHASKFALIHLVDWLSIREYELIDCQQETSHLKQFGAKPMKRDQYLNFFPTKH